MVNVLELNKELLIWVGFTFTNGVWSYPDGVTVDGNTPFFPADETACFKWLVPKVYAECIIIEYLCMIEAYWCKIDREPMDRDIREKGETPALAICLAIKKLKDGNYTA